MFGQADRPSYSRTHYKHCIRAACITYKLTQTKSNGHFRLTGVQRTCQTTDNRLYHYLLIGLEVPCQYFNQLPYILGNNSTSHISRGDSLGLEFILPTLDRCNLSEHLYFSLSQSIHDQQTDETTVTVICRKHPRTHINSYLTLSLLLSRICGFKTVRVLYRHTGVKG